MIDHTEGDLDMKVTTIILCHSNNNIPVWSFIIAFEEAGGTEQVHVTPTYYIGVAVMTCFLG